MSWLSDIGESVFGLTTDLKLADQASWLKPVITAGVNAFGQSQADNTQSQYLDYLRQREQKNYEDSVAAINAYNTQLAAAGGGNSGAGAAAARQNQERQMKASKKANRVSQNTYRKILEMYSPYRDVADRLLPQKTQTYENSLGLQNALAQFVSRPDQVAALTGSVPAWNINVPLPDSVRLK